MKCPKCGANTPGNKRFCENCGAVLAEGKTQATSQSGKAHASGASGKSEASGKTGRQSHTATAHHASASGSGQASTHAAQTTASSSANPFAAMQTAQPSQSAQAQAQSQGAAAGRGKFSIIGIIALVVVVMLAFSMCSSAGNGSNDMANLGATSGFTSGNQGYQATTASTYKPADMMSESEAAYSNDSWTVLLYLCGSNLETEGGLATYNLQELTQAKLSNKVKFVIEAGGAKKWRNTSMNARYLTRAALDSNGFQVVDKLPAASMAVSDTLYDFVKWGTKNYPADHYMVIFWDHGAGSVLGVCQDELFPAKKRGFEDTLTVAEIDKALGKAGVKFDVVGFDTCLMATLETATKMSAYAKYMVASEETEPGYGWDYVAFPEWLSNHTGTDGALLGKQICDSFYTKCRKFGVVDTCTLSVTNLAKMGALGKAFTGVSEEYAKATGSTANLRSLYQAASRTTRFGGDSAYNMVDLGDLMNRTSGIASQYAPEVLAALGDAVVYQVHGRARANVSGLSVFYPLNTSVSEFFYRYLDVVGNVPYAQFLAVMYNKYNEVNWDALAEAVAMPEEPVAEEDLSIAFDQTVNDDGRLQLNITKGADQVADVNVELSLYLEEQKAVVYLGTDHNVTSPEDGVYVDNFNGQWMTIGGNWVCANLLEHGDGYNLYRIPVKLNGVSTNLLALYTFDTGAYEILCACDDPNSTGMSGKSMRALQLGDRIEFVFAATRVGGNAKPFTFTMGSVTYDEGVTMEDADLGAGTYAFSFKITDVLGNQHDAGLYRQVYAEDGTISAQAF